MRSPNLIKSPVKISPIVMGMSQTTKTRGNKQELLNIARTAFEAGMTTFSIAQSVGRPQESSSTLQFNLSFTSYLFWPDPKYSHKLVS
jgi:aryl-alcohol dehydrogenase-like predicted oxidoreductase